MERRPARARNITVSDDSSPDGDTGFRMHHHTLFDRHINFCDKQIEVGKPHRGTTVKFDSLKFNQRVKWCRLPEGTPRVGGGHSEIYGSRGRVFPVGAHLKLCEVKRVHKGGFC